MSPVHNNIEFQKPIIHHLVQFRLEPALIVRPRERGYRVLISVSGIAGSMNRTLDSKARDSGFHKQKLSRFRIPETKKFPIPESVFPQYRKIDILEEGEFLHQKAQNTFLAPVAKIHKVYKNY